MTSINISYDMTMCIMTSWRKVNVYKENLFTSLFWSRTIDKFNVGIKSKINSKGVVNVSDMHLIKRYIVLGINLNTRNVVQWKIPHYNSLYSISLTFYTCLEHKPLILDNNGYAKKFMTP